MSETIASLQKTIQAQVECSDRVRQEHNKELRMANETIVNLRKRITELEGKVATYKSLLDNSGIEIPGTTLW